MMSTNVYITLTLQQVKVQLKSVDVHKADRGNTQPRDKMGEQTVPALCAAVAKQHEARVKMVA